ncbi:hypothetical protein GH714_006102 [Hevea brasiliensis]|uniref:Uncharacterized protein n=1 Tax=Hevea brasiliensis TaxID=3981 RepID=A0A6A6N9I7_HEVBR|nr:hypothetical protein GH714_006102 [Hevea brasiliensis]
MTLSEKKVMGTMDVLVCKMGWQPAAVARVPVVLSYSLERRIVPRCSVVKVLLLKGLIKEDFHLSSVLIPSEKLFLESLISHKFMWINPKICQSISKRIWFETTEKPDSVLRLLSEHGFTNYQIRKIVECRPRVLLSQPEKTLLPKFEFLRSIGVSRLGISIIASRNPNLLTRSIKQHMIPLYEILKSVLVSDKKVVTALKRMRRNFWLYSLSKNLSLLRGLGVSQSSISYLLIQSPSLMCQEVGKFAEGVKKVMKLGFDPSKFIFVEAVLVFHTMTKKTWERKIEVYRRLGWSEDEIWLIFRKRPKCMSLSEKNVMGTMDFLVGKMGWQPAAVARLPIVLCYSLERRIMPRCSVIRVLLLKGLIKADVCLHSVLKLSEELFLERFVIKYQDHVPQLLDIYQRKMGLAELGFGFDDKFKI